MCPEEVRASCARSIPLRGLNGGRNAILFPHEAVISKPHGFPVNEEFLEALFCGLAEGVVEMHLLSEREKEGISSGS
jgi:hypothetical protein